MLAALEAAGYRVQVANDGDSLIVSTRDQIPDVVVLDAQIEGESAIESAYRLKYQPETAEIPIIMLTQFCSAR
jgi:DNA-binding response OmpR family regulator